jgi:hypothetical protein
MSSNLIVRKNKFLIVEKKYKKGGITQLVECMLCMHKVIGSSPITSITNDITQLVEWRNHNPYVVGSSPTFVIF